MYLYSNRCVREKKSTKIIETKTIKTTVKVKFNYDKKLFDIFVSIIK